MKISIVALLILTTINFSYGQSRHLNLGVKNSGICFGNSSFHNGLRLNIWDENVKEINGMNLSVRSYSKIFNGISIAVLADAFDKSNGISFAGLGIGGTKRNGIGIGGISVDCDTLNGLFFGGLGVAGRTPKTPIKVINGTAVGLLAVGAEKISGVMISPIWVYSNKQYGVSIAGFNKTENLHGVQFGLLNYAGNNRKLFRWLPLINFNFSKQPDNNLNK